MDYEYTICHILEEAGKRGLSVRKIALHVFNENNTLFKETTYEEIYTIVRRYLNHSVRYNNSMIKRASRRGYYCLNDSADSIRQQFLNFTNCEENLLSEENDENTIEGEDNYPSLFFDED